MNELALQLQYLPHVKKVKIESLYAPMEQITNFMRIVMQAQKIRPLIRKLQAKRMLRRFADVKKSSSDLPDELLELERTQTYPPAYDWSTAFRDHDTRDSEEPRDEVKDLTTWTPGQGQTSDEIVDTHLADRKRRRSSMPDRQSPLAKRPHPSVRDFTPTKPG